MKKEIHRFEKLKKPKIDPEDPMAQNKVSNSLNQNGKNPLIQGHFGALGNNSDQQSDAD